MDRQERLIILTGPTGSGKTSLALRLAQDVPIEVISADSMQVYRYMDVATAKPTHFERAWLPHHLIDIIDPDAEFNAGRFAAMAMDKIRDVRNRSKIPLVVGGTGLYIKALVYGLCYAPPRSEEIREALRSLIRKKGTDCLWSALQRMDPISAQNISPNDSSRLVRYLEMIFLTGLRPSEIQGPHAFSHPLMEVKVACLTLPRDTLNATIDNRVLAMLEQGIIGETRRLLDMGYHRGLKSMDTLAYKHVIAYLLSEISLDTAIRLIQRDTRHYAKRQITWNRRHYGAECYFSPKTALSTIFAWIKAQTPEPP